jgi:transposase
VILPFLQTVTTDSGTTIEGYKSFLENDVIHYFKEDEPERTMMHDNLSSHKASEIYDTIHNAGHRVICRPPYRPYEAPIEWVFNQLACAVRKRWKKVKNEQDLTDAIIDIIERRDGLGGFYEIFQMCGYISRINSESSNGEGGDSITTNFCPSPTLRLDDEFVSFAADDDDEPWAVGPPNAINIPKDMEARSRRE